jgi:hypothetical protein
MDMAYFRDLLFDTLNDSDALFWCLDDIIWHLDPPWFKLKMKDGSIFLIEASITDNTYPLKID